MKKKVMDMMAKNISKNISKVVVECLAYANEFAAK